jgi:hypothetical protein
MNTQLASYLQGAVVGALATLLAAKIRRSMARRRRHHGGPPRKSQATGIAQVTGIALGDIPVGAPVRFSEGPTIRGNGNGGPSTLKPPISPTPAQFNPSSSVEPLVEPVVDLAARCLALAWDAERQRCIDLGLNPPPTPSYLSHPPRWL